MDHFMLLVALALIFSIVTYYRIVMRGKKGEKTGTGPGAAAKKCAGCGKAFYGTVAECPYCGKDLSGKLGGFLPIAAMAVLFILLLLYFERTWMPG